MTDRKPLRLEWRDARELADNPANWRIHPSAQRNALKAMLKDIGWAGALLYNERTHRLIDGHLRKKISNGTVPVLVGDWTEDEERKILATLDPLSAMAQPEQDKLLALLRNVQFENEAVNAMLEALANGEIQPMPDLTDPEALVDQAEELQKKWDTKRGQIWEIGKHRLMCGDSTNKDEIALLLNGATPLLCVTDPPYGVDYDPAWRNESLRYAARRIGKVPNDDCSNWKAAWDCFPGDVIYSWHPPGAMSIIHAQALEAAGFVLRMQIIWAKANFAIQRGDYHIQHEPCWYAVRKGKSSRRINDRTQTTLWSINLDKNVAGGHSTQKPLECMARPIRNHNIREIYDPFLGSGTTMVAAEQLGRICYAMDIEPKYIAVALERMAGMGLQPKLVETYAGNGNKKC